MSRESPSSLRKAEAYRLLLLLKLGAARPRAAVRGGRPAGLRLVADG